MTEKWKAAHWLAWVLWGMIVVAATMALLTIPNIGSVGIASILIAATAIWLAPLAFSGFHVNW